MKQVPSTRQRQPQAEKYDYNTAMYCWYLPHLCQDGDDDMLTWEVMEHPTGTHWTLTQPDVGRTDDTLLS
jgi:hypothetical protein